MPAPRAFLPMMLPAALLLALSLLCCGCPEGKASKPDESADFNPSEEIPADEPLGQWDGLKLGMTQLELSQIYNAPDGRGEGFIRTLEMYGDVTHHTIIFDERIKPTEAAAAAAAESPEAEDGAAKEDKPADAAESKVSGEAGEEPAGPERKLILSFYRDRLYSIVDRREGFTLAERDAWFAELEKAYGTEHQAILPTSNWRWGREDSIRVDFVQDNASEDFMNGRLWLCHMPTYDASLLYLALWEEEHPGEAKGSTAQ